MGVTLMTENKDLNYWIANKKRLGCFQIILYSIRLIVIFIVDGFEILVICFDG